MNKQKIKAFTLVELIVVVTILGVLSTIGFVSYSSYLTGVRDTNRISNMKALSDGLELFRTKNTLPLPDDYVEVKASGEIIAYQGYVGSNIIETIDFSSEGVDPKDGTYYSYYLTKDRKYYQLMGFLEEETDLQTAGIFNQTNAIDYSIKHPTVYGKKLGILTGTGTDLNIPIQEILDIKNSGYLDIALTNNEYIARFKDGSQLSGTGIDLQYLNTISSGVGGIGTSCNVLINRVQSLKGKDGIYLIDPTGDNPFPIYCDMTTDGGGRSFVARMDGLTAASASIDLFGHNYGEYKLDRIDNELSYSIRTNIFQHTEMMATLDSPNPKISEGLNKIIFYKYSLGDKSFNYGPISHVYGNNFSYKLTTNGNYIEGGIFSDYLNAYWYSVGNQGQQLLNFRDGRTGNLWGVGMGGDGVRNHDGYYYIR